MEYENPLISVSMDIIIHAGDARTFAFSAIEAAKSGDFDQAEAKLAEAETAIVEAHRAQTDVIQTEMNGEEHDLCILFIHAQDTLMTIRSEINMAREFVTLYRVVHSLQKAQG